MLVGYGLEWHEGWLDFYNTDRPVRTASASQVRKPIYTTSTAGRWKKYEKYLHPLLDEIGDIVEERSEEHTSELQSLIRISYAVFCLKKKHKPEKHKPIRISYNVLTQNKTTTET